MPTDSLPQLQKKRRLLCLTTFNCAPEPIKSSSWMSNLAAKHTAWPEFAKTDYVNRGGANHHYEFSMIVRRRGPLLSADVSLKPWAGWVRYGR